MSAPGRLRRSRLLLMLMVITLAVGCGGQSGSGSGPSGVTGKPTTRPALSGVTVKLVGNATCPAAGQSAYFRSQLPVNRLPAVGQAVDEMPHTHVRPPATVTYLHDPPTSGCHYNLGYGPGKAPIPAGAYPASTVRDIHPESWVHNLEHGYVVVLYNCPSGCDREFNQLSDWLKALPDDPASGRHYAKVLILPELTMKPSFAVVCWDWYDPMDRLSINEVQRFYDNHVDNAPEVNTAQ